MARSFCFNRGMDLFLGLAGSCLGCAVPAAEGVEPGDPGGATSLTETTASEPTVYDCATIAETGTQPGDYTPDFELLDQFGQPVTLYASCSSVVYLVSGATW